MSNVIKKRNYVTLSNAKIVQNDAGHYNFACLVRFDSTRNPAFRQAKRLFNMPNVCSMITLVRQWARLKFLSATVVGHTESLDFSCMGSPSRQEEALHIVLKQVHNIGVITLKILDNVKIFQHITHVHFYKNMKIKG